MTNACSFAVTKLLYGLEIRHRCKKRNYVFLKCLREPKRQRRAEEIAEQRLSIKAKRKKTQLSHLR